MSYISPIVPVLTREGLADSLFLNNYRQIKILILICKNRDISSFINV